jgi:hypothetical protein
VVGADDVIRIPLALHRREAFGHGGAEDRLDVGRPVGEVEVLSLADMASWSASRCPAIVVPSSGVIGMAAANIT